MKSHEHKNRKNTEGGFTIIEVLVALIIFSVAITGVITVAVQGGISATAAKDKVTAQYLADEGIELMRGMRDTEVLQYPSSAYSSGWAGFVTAAVAECATAHPCDIDGADFAGSAGVPPPPFPSIDTNFVPCHTTYTGLSSGVPTSIFCPLSYDSNPITGLGTGYYNDDGDGTASPYARALVITPLTDTVTGNTDEVRVTSTIVWKEGQTMQSVTETENLFNWYSA